MKFGKLTDISAVNFDLPDDPRRTKDFSVIPSSNEAPTLYVGATGWSMKEWVGSIYPRKSKKIDFLKHYTRQFNTIELNTTHYRIPTFETIHKWRRDSAEDFKFCPKIPQSISHSKSMGINDGKLINFCETIVQLNEKLGCCFIQLPPYFDINRMETFVTFLKYFPAEIPLAVEVRHASWFKDEKTTNRLAELLHKNNHTFVITDVAGRRDVLHLQMTNTTAMIRFVGNNLHPSDFTRIDAWIDKLSNWFDKGLREVYFFTHEPDNINAPQLAQYLVEKASKYIPNIITRGPSPIKEEGTQMSLF